MAKMSIAPSDRPKVKAECLRLMVTLKLNPVKSRLISKFVDTYLRLNAREEGEFRVEIDKLELGEKEAVMQTMISWEEKGLEKATRTIALNMLRKNLALETIAEMTGLTIAEVQALQGQVNE